MTTGSYTVYPCQGGQTVITWNGSDDPVHKKAVNPYIKSIRTQCPAPAGSFVLNESGTPVDISGTYIYGTVHQTRPYEPDDLFPRNVGKLADRLQGDLSWTPLVSVGEGRETIQMISQGARRLARAIRSARGGRFSDAIETLAMGAPPDVRNNLKRSKWTWRDGTMVASAALDNWMLYRYGIRPLVNDVQNAGETLAALSQQVRKTSFTVTSSSSSPLEHVDGSIMRGSYETHGNCLHVTVSNLPSPREALGLTDLASVAWELTSLSWMADWILPVGQYLERERMLRSVNQYSWYMTTKWKKVVTGYVYGSSPSGVGGKGVHPARSYSVDFQRSAVSGTNLGTLHRLKFRSSEEVFGRDSWSRAIDTIAVLKSRIF